MRQALRSNLRIMTLRYLSRSESKSLDVKSACVAQSVAQQPFDIPNVQQYNTFNGYIKQHQGDGVIGAIEAYRGFLKRCVLRGTVALGGVG
jgi:hypothetical protein